MTLNFKTVTSQKSGPQETLNRMGPALYREAYEQGHTLTQHLEELHPHSEYRDGLDGFQRLLAVAGIRVRSFPQLGIWADTWDAFERSNNTWMLLPEFYARAWRSVKFAPRGEHAQILNEARRDLFLSDDEIPGSLLNPYAEAMALRENDVLTAAIPLSELVATTTPITGENYRAAYIVKETAQQRMRRVSEDSEIPHAKITTAEQNVSLHKYGRVIEASYETLRRMRIDKVARFIQLMAVQAEVDKVEAAIGVIVAGDGNANTAAATHNLTTLDSAASAGTLSLKAWLAFQKKFENPYMLTTALMQEDVALQLEMLTAGNANIARAVYQTREPGIFGSGLTPVNKTAGNVRYGWTTVAPALKIVGFDRRVTLEHVTEIGANIDEIERHTTRQTQTMTMTEVDGWAIMDTEGALILDVNA